MGFYRNRDYLNEGCKSSCKEDLLPDVNTDQLIDMDSVRACFEESSTEAAARICYENTLNWGRLIEAVTIDEMTCLDENGVESLNEGERFDAFIEKAKSFFKAVWEKIQSLIKKAVMQFNSFFMSDKEFLKKYKKDINANMNTKDVGDKEVEVYDYVFYGANYSDGIAAAITDMESRLDNYIDISSLKKSVSSQSELDNLKKEYESYTKEEQTKNLNLLRGNLLDKENTEVEANEFVKEIKNLVQGDDSKQSVAIKTFVPKCMKFLEDSASIKTALNNLLKVSKKAIENSIKQCEDMKNALGKDVKGEVSIANQAAGIKQNLATKYIDVLKSSKNITVQYIGVVLNELKACSRQSKFVCTKLVTMKASKDSVNASYVYSSEGSIGSSIIESVQFV